MSRSCGSELRYSCQREASPPDDDAPGVLLSPPPTALLSCPPPPPPFPMNQSSSAVMRTSQRSVPVTKLSSADGSCAPLPCRCCSSRRQPSPNTEMPSSASSVTTSAFCSGSERRARRSPLAMPCTQPSMVVPCGLCEVVAAGTLQPW